MLFALLACTAKPVPGPPTARPAPVGGAAQEYIVRWGDSLWWIASHYSVPGGIEGIVEDNGIYDMHYIQAGERLRLTGLAHPALSSFPTYGEIDADYETCTVAVQEDVMGWPGVPSAFCATGLTIVEAQLDKDKPLEVLAGCLQEDTGVGMTTWKVAVVDGPALTQTIQLANFGETSMIEGPMGCELLATSWETVPVEMSYSWHLLGRRMRLNNGELAFASRELRSRRLFYSFEPEDVAEDLSHKTAKIRSIEPALQGEVQSKGEAVVGQGLQFDLGYGLQSDPTARFGDSRTRLLYPTGYVPRNLEGRTVRFEVLRVGVWGQTQTVLWL
ncbi:MAG: hypothetical protein GY913_24100 [Proteobacteria bacterium]|nr:hypothetical protein [Pseudomonadota bacterium]MCP4919997.1 hypothetical protein [Pseudomonadota bacterium]